MNIQPSVIIWTVICFTLLMLILRNGVFKPVLKVLDQRREKLNAARAKKAEYQRRREELAADAETAKAKSAEEMREKFNAAVEEMQSEEKAKAKAAQRKCLDDLGRYREELGSDYEKILKEAGPQMKEVAGILAQKIAGEAKN